MFPLYIYLFRIFVFSYVYPLRIYAPSVYISLCMFILSFVYLLSVSPLVCMTLCLFSLYLFSVCVPPYVCPLHISLSSCVCTTVLPYVHPSIHIFPCVYLLYLYVPPSMCITVYTLYRMYTPSCVVYTLPCLYSIVYIFHHVYTSPCVNPTVYTFHYVYTPPYMYTSPCVHSTMCTLPPCMSLHMYISLCIFFYLYIPSIYMSLRVYVPPYIHSTVCTLHRVYTSPCIHSTVCTFHPVSCPIIELLRFFISASHFSVRFFTENCQNLSRLWPCAGWKEVGLANWFAHLLPSIRLPYNQASWFFLYHFLTSPSGFLPKIREICTDYGLVQIRQGQE